MIRVSEYTAKKLADLGARHVFMLTGGGAMFLNDALGHEPRLHCTFNHHEQACAMAAEGYARVAGTPAVVNVTTGPGGINALNGVFGAWVDSIPMVVVSGQVKRETLMSTYEVPGLRQIGDQEADILRMVEGITKYSAMVTDPTTIRYHLEKAWHLAVTGRPGPCWLDIPIDVSTSKIEPDELVGYDAAVDSPAYEDDLPAICREILMKLANADRPVLLAGKGIRLGNALSDFEHVIRELGIPVVPAWTSLDLLGSDDPLFCGRAGDIATRAGNFTVQNADVLLVVGSRLGLRQVSYNWGSFARFAYRIQVDVDAAELSKPFPKPDLPVHADAGSFLAELSRQLSLIDYKISKHAAWLGWCKERVERYPTVLPKHREPKDGRINPYHFIDRLFSHLTDDAVVVCGDGTANVVTFQAAQLKKGQRIVANSGNASMGFDLPAAVGAAVARGGKDVVCLAGDGSLQLNIQELQTIVHNKLPIKLFVMNNDGYLSIRVSQQNMFKRVTGESAASGVSFPDIVKVAEAYGIPAIRAEYDTLESSIAAVLAHDGPMICDVMLDPDQPFEPRVTAKQLSSGAIVSSNLEEMFPFLEEQELAENMLVPLVHS